MLPLALMNNHAWVFAAAMVVFVAGVAAVLTYDDSRFPEGTFARYEMCVEEIEQEFYGGYDIYDIRQTLVDHPDWPDSWVSGLATANAFRGDGYPEDSSRSYAEQAYRRDCYYWSERASDRDYSKWRAELGIETVDG